MGPRSPGAVKAAQVRTAKRLGLENLSRRVAGLKTPGFPAVDSSWGGQVLGPVKKSAIPAQRTTQQLNHPGSLKSSRAKNNRLVPPLVRKSVSKSGQEIRSLNRLGLRAEVHRIQKDAT